MYKVGLNQETYVIILAVFGLKRLARQFYFKMKTPNL